MTSTDGMHPFEPTIGAAVNAAQERIAEVRAAQASMPDQWQALRLSSFWNGDSAVVLVKPDSISPMNLTVTANGALQEYKGGLGVVAVLVRGSATHVIADYSVETAQVQMTLPIRDL